MSLIDEVQLFIDKEKALLVRQLRVEEGYSFRALAHECIETWKVDWPDIQPVGEDLCRISMQFFNESWTDGW